MNKDVARSLLNRVKAGHSCSLIAINEALIATGDLDVFRSSFKVNQPLRPDGYEPSLDWSSKTSDSRAGAGRLWHVVRYWAADKRED